jgi:hypothetical protein
MNRSAKGNYHRNKTKEWLETQGYIVAPLESTKRIYLPAKNGEPEKVIFSKTDIWGSDLVARNENHVVFVQVKANASHISQGIKDLSHGPWPASVARWVVHWPERRRTVQGPDIIVL